ncbi:aldose epimerase family protein [Deinococcus cellulosilyticus]|uniref:Aldose 1-epimerase n=1 Tax=Deinococcus cellulosilyticus (strain DSM 18568 / NBRC 106333 / KACC 11606 / 5516J-15) TaxID=1223518 RepID=A0A511N1N9_DEIC1|nr:aldose epimerase family protein [Deinococcus cellulosilyticus]GEM46775.1 aldose 1-epimerase [Deinococcus cellulosilyticus NBRC 106333 = KACC 11606]
MPTRTQPISPSVHREPWGHLPSGEEVSLYTLRNASGLTAQISEFGAVLVSLRTPDRQGKFEDVVLGHHSLEPYLDRSTAQFFGATIGRFGNRIAGGQFDLEGRTYRLAQNNGPNSLHGGPKGFDQVLWSGSGFVDDRGVGVRLQHLSPDGEEGYPGNLQVTVTYTLTDLNELHIDYQASTDQTTILNLTNHSFFNLSGSAKTDILGHELTLYADQFTPTDSNLIPTGDLLSVQGTALDFRSPQTIGARIHMDDVHLRTAGGYDHNFVLRNSGLRHAATLYEPVSGRVLETFTTEPGIQLYSGNFLDGTVTGKNGRRYEKHLGVCLETQHFPDSPNKPRFPSTVLRPGQAFHSKTIYAFKVRPLNL